MTSLTVAPLRVLKDPQDQSYYEILERIGEGTFSVVYRAERKETLVNDEPTNSRHRQNKKRKSSRNKEVKMTIYNDTNSDNHRRDKHTIVALKCIHPNSSPKRILNELRFLKTLGGKNGCLPLLGGFRETCGFIAILPYFEHDDFKWYLPRLTTDLLRAYLYGLFRSLKHVHQHGIIHRDIKPRNYLFSLSKRKGLLIDFGLAQGPKEWQPALLRKNCKWDGSKVVSINNSFEGGSSSGNNNNDGGVENINPSSSRRKKKKKQRRGTQSSTNDQLSEKQQPQLSLGKVRAERAGTPGFRAPEVLFMSLEQTPSIDIWSVGIIMLSLLSSRYPIFPKPEVGNISSDAQAIAQMEALLGRDALERAARACKKHLVETPGDKAQLATPPSLKILCTQGRQAFYDSVLKENGDGPLDVFPDSVYDLLNKCLEIVPDDRISARGALEHPFFTEKIQVV